MGVGVEREAGGEVTEHTGHRLDVHTILKRNGRKGMAEIVESDLWDTCPCQHSL